MFGLADCNNFYCSCERVFRPDLRGRPVVVLSNNDGCVIARSEEAKALGIKMGAVFYQVRDLLERQGVAVFSSNYNLYGDMSRRVHNMLRRYSPRVQVYSIDEAFLDLNGMGSSEALTRQGREMVRAITRGTGIPISLGIAPTKTLAKMASKFAKRYPGYHGCCLIDTPQKREKALQLFPLADVWGVGWRYAQKLDYYGLHTAWDLAQKSEAWVRREMHVTGVRTWSELNGVSCISIDEPPRKQSICTSRSLPGQGLDRLRDVEEAVANHAAQCSRKLRAQGSACRAVTVLAQTSAFRDDRPADGIVVTTHPPVATNDLRELVSLAVTLLRAAWKGDGRYLYKRAGVVVTDIVPQAPVQGNLFDPTDRPRQARLGHAIDRINRREGHNTVRVAVQGYGKRWHLKNEFLSHQYTTNPHDLLHMNQRT